MKKEDIVVKTYTKKQRAAARELKRIFDFIHKMHKLDPVGMKKQMMDFHQSLQLIAEREDIKPFDGTNILKQKTVDYEGATSKRFKVEGPTIKYNIKRKDDGK